MEVQVLTMLEFSINPALLECCKCGVPPKPHCGAGHVFCGFCVNSHKESCASISCFGCCRVLEAIGPRIEVQCPCGGYVPYCQLREHERECPSAKSSTPAQRKCRVNKTLLLCSACGVLLSPPVFKHCSTDVLVCTGCYRADNTTYIHCAEMDYLLEGMKRNCDCRLNMDEHDCPHRPTGQKIAPSSTQKLRATSPEFQNCFDAFVQQEMSMLDFQINHAQLECWIAPPMEVQCNCGTYYPHSKLKGHETYCSSAKTSTPAKRNCRLDMAVLHCSTCRGVPARHPVSKHCSGNVISRDFYFADADSTHTRRTKLEHLLENMMVTIRLPFSRLDGSPYIAPSTTPKFCGEKGERNIPVIDKNGNPEGKAKEQNGQMKIGAEALKSKAGNNQDRDDSIFVKDNVHRVSEQDSNEGCQSRAMLQRRSGKKRAADGIVCCRKSPRLATQHGVKQARGKLNVE